MINKSLSNRNSLYNSLDDWDALFLGPWSHLRSRKPESSFPAVDISENENEYLLEMDAPGVQKEDINISFEGGILKVSGERFRENNEGFENVSRSERAYGKFERSFSLPEEIISEDIGAEFKDGVLSITVPKSEKSKPRQIPVN